MKVRNSKKENGQLGVFHSKIKKKIHSMIKMRPVTFFYLICQINTITDTLAKYNFNIFLLIL